MTWDWRSPSGMVTVAWIRADGLSSSFQASAAFICLCSRKVPGSSAAGLLLALTAEMKAPVLAITPRRFSRGASEIAVSPTRTLTWTTPWPLPVKFAGCSLAWTYLYP